MRMKAGVWAVVLCAGAAVGQTTYELEPGKGLTPVAREERDPDRALLGEVRRLLAEGQFKPAYEKVHAWIAGHEESDSPALPEAYVLRGTALVGMGREYK